MSLAANGNVSAISMGGTKVNITTTGIARYEGTSGNDTINASAVTSVDNSEKIMYLYGGLGNDTITTGNIAGGGFMVQGGAGNDCITGGAGSDTILVGDETLLAVGYGNDIITTGAGSDVIRVFASAAGTATTAYRLVR